MTHEAKLNLPGLLLTSLLVSIGCGDGTDSNATPATSTTPTGPTVGPTGGGAPGVAPAVGGVCPATTDAAGNLLVMASEANNYTFTSTLSFPPVLVAPESELTFDWSAVTLDFLGHPLNPSADIDNALVMLWKLTEADLGIKLNADELRQQDLAIIATTPTEKMATSKSLFEFGTPGLMPGQAPFTPEEIMPFLNITSYPAESHIYTVMIGSGPQYSSGTRMIQSFKLDPTSTTTQVNMTNESTRLDFTVDLQSLQQTPVPVGNPGITVDWSAVATTALGTEFVRNSIGSLAVVRFSETPAELQARFLDLIDYNGDIQATDLWTYDIASGESATLSNAVNAAGAPFAGIDDTGTWMLALFCFNCRNPAPWYLTFLTPCSG